MAKAKSAAKSKGAKTERTPFPFLGQGDASYFEWFEMWVWFETPVPKAERAELGANGPPPCLRDLQWPQPALMWPSTGDQWIGRHPTEAYGSRNSKRSSTTRSSAGIVEMHAKHPIRFAVRREGSEAGGTKLGVWHEDSVESFVERVSPALEALAKKKLAKDDKRRTAITLALNYAAWTNDDRTFDTVGALLDETPEALRWYLTTTADALDAKRPGFAERVRALLPAPAAKRAAGQKRKRPRERRLDGCRFSGEDARSK